MGMKPETLMVSPPWAIATGLMVKDVRLYLEEAEALGEATRTYCRSLGEPPSTTMFEHVYTAPHPLVEEERAGFAEYEQSFVTEGGGR